MHPTYGVDKTEMNLIALAVVRQALERQVELIEKLKLIEERLKEKDL